jgi:hypothetical protein
MVMARYCVSKNEPQNVMDTVCDSQPNRKMATNAWGGRKTDRKVPFCEINDSVSHRKMHMD